MSSKDQLNISISRPLDTRPPPPNNSSHDPPPPVVVVAPSSSKDSHQGRPHGNGLTSYSTALGVTILVGCSLLLLNVILFVFVFLQRDRGQRKKSGRHGSSSSVTSDNSMRKLENGGPMATICVTSGKRSLRKQWCLGRHNQYYLIIQM